jgi:tripartite-type tricarboxylate transporter receptor subunit TctC
VIVRILLSILLGCAAIPGATSAQNFPLKPVRILTGEPGASLDFAARLVAQALSGGFGQPVIVENRGGASGAVAAQTVARASPDGYTMILYGSTLWIAPLMQKLPYDAVRDFAPITLVTAQPNILVVNPSVAAKSVSELIALARAKPGEINFATGQLGSTNHLAALLFKSMAAINIVHIPYKGTGAALPDLVAGRVQMMFPNAGAVTDLIKSGRLRALAVTSLQPSALVPGVPTVTATGLPGYESIATQGIFAPARTPPAIVNRLNQEIVRVLNLPDIKEKFLATGVEVVGNLPRQFAATVKSDIERLGKVIRDAGIKIE